MSTQGVTTAVLAAHLGSPPQYGETAADVLQTCALVAAAERHWDPEQVARFQEEVGIHEKVWGRLLAIHRCNRWQDVDQSDLPGNYTALYALTTLSDEAWATLLKGEMLNPQLTSRRIQDWALIASSVSKVYKRRSVSSKKGDNEEGLRQVRLVLTCTIDQASIVNNVLGRMKAIAAEDGMVLSSLDPTPGFGPAGTPEQTVEIITKDLRPMLTTLLDDAGKVLRDKLNIQTENDLLDASMRDFLKFINRTAGSTLAAHELYGKQYCLKLALEYNRMSNTRANRFNYKKKLEGVAECADNEGLKQFARIVFRDFIGEVPGEK